MTRRANERLSSSDSVSPAASPSSERQPAWTIADDVVDFDHYDCSSTVPLLPCGATVQLNLTGLADGVYSVTVRAVDSRMSEHIGRRLAADGEAATPLS